MPWKQLEEWILKAFKTSDFHQTLYYTTWSLKNHVPSPDKLSPKDYVKQAVAELRRRNLGNAPETKEFFDLMRKERPLRKTEINALEQALQAATSQPSPQPSPQPLPLPPSVTRITLSVTGNTVRLAYDYERENGPPTPMRPTESLDESKLDSLKEMIQSFRSSPYDSDKYHEIGIRLTQAVLHGSVRDAFSQAYNQINSRENGQIHLELELDDQQGRLPWELLRHPEDVSRIVLAEKRNIRLSRLVSSNVVHRSVTTEKRQLLVVWAESDPGKKVLAQAEAEAIKDLWNEAGLDAHCIPEVTKDEFWNAIEEHPWSVVHYCGHGVPGALVLSKNVRLDAEPLRRMFADRVSEAVYLSACYGNAPVPEQEDPISGPRFSGLAAILTNTGVPHVLACAARLDANDAKVAAIAWHTEFLNSGNPFEATLAARRKLLRSSNHAYALLNHFHSRLSETP